MAKKTVKRKTPKRTASKPKAQRSRKSVSAKTRTRAGTAKRRTTAVKTTASRATKSKRTTGSSASRKTTPSAKTGTTKKSATRRKTAKKRAGPRTTTATAAQAATTQDPIQFPEQRPRQRKTHLSAKDLEEFKELLLRKRAELAGDVEHLTREALNTKGASYGEHSAMPIHMADLGSDNWEQEFTLGLIANEQALVREIDEALDRILNRTYGVCLATNRKITKARLRAQPWAKYCIEYARAREEGRAP